jgi:hypothetical protein
MRTFRMLALVLLRTVLWHAPTAAQDAGSDSYWYGRFEYRIVVRDLGFRGQSRFERQ